MHPMSIHLRECHDIFKVEDAEKITLRKKSTIHLDRTDCECDRCTFDREELGCKYPNICTDAAENLLGQLGKEWDPRAHRDEPETRQDEQQAPVGKNIIKWTDNEKPRCISDALRLVATNKTLNPEPDTSQDDDMEVESPRDAIPIAIHVAGLCKNPSSTDAQAGSGIKSDKLNLEMSYRTPGTQTAFAAEMYAVRKALENTNRFEEIKIISTSKRLIKALTSDFKCWEDRGWIDAPNSDIVRQVITRLRNRVATTLLELETKLSRESRMAKDLAKRGSKVK